jgi:hypothetical protein
MHLNFKTMKKLIIFSGIIILFFVGIACEKTIEIDLDDAKIRIVLNAELRPDSTIKVNITRSRHILDNAEISVLADAVVKLYEDDVFIGNMTYTSGGFYKIDYYPVKGKTYKIEVEHSSFDKVSGLTTIPENVQFSGIDTMKTFDENGNEGYNFSIKFTDPSVEPNYYMVSLRNRYSYEMWDDNMIIYDTLYVGPDTTIVNIEYGGYRMVKTTDKLWFQTDDMIVDANVYYNNAAVFSDELINGEQYSLKLRIDKYSLYSDTNMVYVDFYAISPEYYKYMVSYTRHQDASSDPFAEPVMVFSNIVDGIGILGSASVYTDSVKIVSQGGGYVYY